MYFTQQILFYTFLINILGINSFLFGGGGSGGGCCCCASGGGGGGGCCGGRTRSCCGGGSGGVNVNCRRGRGGCGGGGYGGGGCSGYGGYGGGGGYGGSGTAGCNGGGCGGNYGGGGGQIGCSGGCSGYGSYSGGGSGGSGTGSSSGGCCQGCEGSIGNSGPPQISCSGEGCSNGGVVQNSVISAAENQPCEPKYVIVRPVGTESGGYAQSVPAGCGSATGGYAQEQTAYSHQQIPSGSYEPVQLPIEQQQPSQQYEAAEAPASDGAAAAIQSPPANQELPLPPTEQVQPASTKNEVVEEEVSAPSAPTNEQLQSEPYKQQKSAIKALHGSKTTTTLLTKTSNISKENTEICNSIELSQLMETLMVENDANESKRRLHKATNQQFITEGSDRGLDVICAPGAFSYRIATDFFCERTKGNITCFVYQQQP